VLDINTPANATWEYQFIEVYMETNNMKPLIIGNIYRLPRQTIENIKEFTNDMSVVLSDTIKNRTEVLICPDFNLDLLKSQRKYSYLKLS